MTAYLPMSCPQVISIPLWKSERNGSIRGDVALPGGGTWNTWTHSTRTMCYRLVFFKGVTCSGEGFAWESRTVLAPRKTEDPFDPDGERPYVTGCWGFGGSWHSWLHPLWLRSQFYDGACFANAAEEQICWLPGGSENYFGWDGGLDAIVDEEQREEICGRLPPCSGWSFDVFLVVRVVWAYPKYHSHQYYTAAPAKPWREDVYGWFCGPMFDCEEGGSS